MSENATLAVSCSALADGAGMGTKTTRSRVLDLRVGKNGGSSKRIDMRKRAVSAVFSRMTIGDGVCLSSVESRFVWSKNDNQWTRLPHAYLCVYDELLASHLISLNQIAMELFALSVWHKTRILLRRVTAIDAQTVTHRQRFDAANEYSWIFPFSTTAAVYIHSFIQCLRTFCVPLPQHIGSLRQGMSPIATVVDCPIYHTSKTPQ